MMKRKHVKRLMINILMMTFLFINFFPLLIALSNSFRSPKNQTSALKFFIEFSLDSYKIAFDKMNYFVSLRNSLLLTSIAVVVIVVIAAMAAYPMARMKTKTGRLLSMFFLAGIIVPGQLTIIPVYRVIKVIGISGTQLAPLAMFITCSLPVATFIYTGFISSSIPIELEEAAVVDGAGKFYRFWKIVFPLLSPASVAVAITQGIWIWNDFFLPLLFIGKKANRTLPLAMLQFMGDKENPTQWNVLFAACFLSAIALLIIFGFLQRRFIDGLTAGAVKG